MCQIHIPVTLVCCFLFTFTFEISYKLCTLKFIFQTNPKDSENLLRALDWRVQQLRVQEERIKGPAMPEKRKAEPESPSEDITVKKIK